MENKVYKFFMNYILGLFFFIFIFNKLMTKLQDITKKYKIIKKKILNDAVDHRTNEEETHKSGMINYMNKRKQNTVIKKEIFFMDNKKNKSHIII